MKEEKKAEKNKANTNGYQYQSRQTTAPLPILKQNNIQRGKKRSKRRKKRKEGKNQSYISRFTCHAMIIIQRKKIVLTSSNAKAVFQQLPVD